MCPGRIWRRTIRISGPALTYLTSDELAQKGRWDWITPTCQNMGADGVCDTWNLADEPDDPLMVESILPRSGTNPATNAALADPNSAPGANPINGHESNIFMNNDLQYACIFELPTPRDCTSVSTGSGCDCFSNPDPSTLMSPLCQGTDGSYSTVQRYAKAYPGVRQLEVARDLGPNAIVSSACPKTLGPTSPAHAYVPVFDSLARQLVGRLLP